MKKFRKTLGKPQIWIFPLKILTTWSHGFFQYLNKNLDWNTFFSSFLQIRTPFNYLLMNLVLAETLIAVFGLPIDFLASYYYGWKMGKSVCILTGFILSTSGKFSSFFSFCNLVHHERTCVFKWQQSVWFILDRKTRCLDIQPT